MLWAQSAPLVEIGLSELLKTGRAMAPGPTAPRYRQPCCKTSRRWKKKYPFVAHFKPAKKNLSSHFEWMDTSTRPSLREEMRNKKRKMEFKGDP